MNRYMYICIQVCLPVDRLLLPVNTYADVSKSDDLTDQKYPLSSLRTYFVRK